MDVQHFGAATDEYDGIPDFVRSMDRYSTARPVPETFEISPDQVQPLAQYFQRLLASPDDYDRLFNRPALPTADETEQRIRDGLSMFWSVPIRVSPISPS